MNKIKIEYRSEFGFNEEERTISGYALKFESWSKDLGGYTEILRSGCLTQELVNSCDVILNYNHNDENILARSINGEGTLKLTVDDIGLKFECVVPETQLGNDLYYHIRSGNLNECSFAFYIDTKEENTQRIYRDSDGKICREIFKISEIFDCAICPHGAYASTSVQARNMEDAKSEIEEIERREKVIGKLDKMIESLAELID